MFFWWWIVWCTSGICNLIHSSWEGCGKNMCVTCCCLSRRVGWALQLWESVAPNTSARSHRRFLPEDPKNDFFLFYLRLNKSDKECANLTQNILIVDTLYINGRCIDVVSVLAQCDTAVVNCMQNHKFSWTEYFMWVFSLKRTRLWLLLFFIQKIHFSCLKIKIC